MISEIENELLIIKRHAEFIFTRCGLLLRENDKTLRPGESYLFADDFPTAQLPIARKLTLNALKNSPYTTCGLLRAASFQDLVTIPYFGRKGLADLQELLQRVK